jgi:hypothetical protein
MGWNEVLMFFAGFLFGGFYFRKEILDGMRWREWGKQQVRNQQAYMSK